MLKRSLVGVAALMMLADGPAARADSTAVPPDPGRGDFMNYCVACHGVGAKGDGTGAEFLTINAADLTQMAARNGGIFPRQRAIEVIDGQAQVAIHGERDMPIWGDWFKFEASPDGAGDKTEKIVRERIDALVGYLDSIQQY